MNNKKIKNNKDKCENIGRFIHKINKRDINVDILRGKIYNV